MSITNCSSSSISEKCSCIDCGGLGTFVDLTKTRELKSEYRDISMDDLRYKLPSPGKVKGWLVPERCTMPSIPITELVLGNSEKFLVGREHTCDFLLEEHMFPSSSNDLQCSNASRVQFEIVLENDVLFISDLSMNGTFLNCVRLKKDIARRLNHGDMISILQAEFLFFSYLDEIQLRNLNYPVEILRKYVVGNIVGSGSYSVVRKGFARNTKSQVALKFIKKNNHRWCENADESENLLSEVDILKQLHHPCIIKIIDVVQTSLDLVIVTELAEGGELDKQTRKDFIMGSLTEDSAKFRFYQICHTTAYIHSKNICHRDLKLANILLMEPSQSSILKIGDFGASKSWSSTKVLESLVGTPAFMAPEVIALTRAPNLSYTSKSDCWSLGVILYILLSGEQPFNQSLDVLPLSSQIQFGRYKQMEGGLWDKVSHQAKDLVSKLLVVNVNDRLSASEILQHGWFVDDDLTCSQSRNIMFGTQDSEAGSIASLPISSDSGLDSKAGSHSREPSLNWQEPEDMNIEKVYVDGDNIRSRLRPRPIKYDDSNIIDVVGTPKKMQQLLSNVIADGRLPIREKMKNAAANYNGKRQRRVSEKQEKSYLVGTSGVAKIGKAPRRRRKTGF